MDTSTRLCSIHRCSIIFLNTSIRWNKIWRKNSIWCILLGCNYMFRLFIYFPYIMLSFRNCGKIIFKVCSQCRHIGIFIVIVISFNIIFYLLFFRLDYVGIALLIMGSFVPWLYYGFYCYYEHKIVYLSIVLFLGVSSIFVSLYDKFSEPSFRPFRAGKIYS